MGKLGDMANRASEKAAKAMEKIVGAAEEASEAIENTGKASEKAGKKIEDTGKKTKTAGAKAKESAKGIDEFTKALQGLVAAANKIGGAADKLDKLLYGDPNKKGRKTLYESVAKNSQDTLKTVNASAEAATKRQDKMYTDMDKRQQRHEDNLKKSLKRIEQLYSSQNLLIKENAIRGSYAEDVLTNVGKQLTPNQRNRIERAIEQLRAGDLTNTQFAAKAARASKIYSEAWAKGDGLDLSSLTGPQRAQVIRDREKNAARERDSIRKNKTAELDIRRKAAKDRETLAEKSRINDEKIARQTLLDNEKFQSSERRQNEKHRQQMETETAKTKKANEDAARASAKRVKQEADTADKIDKVRDNFEKRQAARIFNRQKLARNRDAQSVLYGRFGDVLIGEDDLETNLQRRADNAINRVTQTLRNLQEFAERGGHHGTVGQEETALRQVEALKKAVYETAKEQKYLNSEEGKFAQTLERSVEDAKKLQSSVNRIHTAFGQLASSTSAFRAVATQLRQTMMHIAQPAIQIIQGISSQAFKSALDAMKKLELSEIGFGNFFGPYAVSSIMSNIKQNALLSPMSAAQLASYVSQIAPLSNGNSTLATNAAMGVAKMIQYSGSDVTTEMEYVVRNLRDVIAKNKATTIDIRQFNRAMPALKKVLQEMGLEEFLKDGEISINKENASQLLQAFAKINESEGVGDIFNKTSETIAGLMERMEEQMQFLIIDVANFSGLTKFIKDTIHEILESSDSIISDIKMSLQFIGNNVMRWFKSRDWEAVAAAFSEALDIVWNALKEAAETLRQALGGFDWKTTLKNFAKLLGEFVKGIANSYSWMLGIANTVSQSGVLGSGVLQIGAKAMGFMSGNAGILITGALRSFGNAMGVLNQAIGAVVRGLEVWHKRLILQINTIGSFTEAINIVTQSSTILAESFNKLTATMGMSLEQLEQEALARKAAKNSAQAQAIAARTRDRMLPANAGEEEEILTADGRRVFRGSGKKKSGLLGPSSTGEGTRLYEIISKTFSGVMAGVLTGTLSSIATEWMSKLFTNDTVNQRMAGNTVGSIAGFTVGGAKIGSIFAPGAGTIIGGIIGSIGGIIKSAIEAIGIEDQRRQEEVNEVKERVSQGDYLRDLLKATRDGNTITDNDFDTLNSALVKQANNFNAAFPNGTAQMLKDYLSQTVVNGKNIHDAVVESGKKFEEQGDNLWALIEKGDIEGANEYANVLYENAGYTSAQIAAMIIRGAEKSGWTNENGQISDLLLQWGNVQDKLGKDLTYSYIQQLQEQAKTDSSAKATLDGIREQLLTLWQDLGMDLTKDTNLSTEEKKDYARKFAEEAVHMLFGEEVKDAGIFTKLFGIAGVEDAEATFGLKLTEEQAQQMSEMADFYGLNGDNIGMWFSSNSQVQSVLEQWLNSLNAIETTQKDMYDVAQKMAAEGSAAGIDLRKIRTQIENGVYKPDRVHSSGTGRYYGSRYAHKAAGGPIRGVDIVPTMLQPGEYVVRKSAVDKIGLTALNALNTGNVGYFARAFGRQNIYGDYSNAKTWNTTSNDNRRSINNIVKVYNNSRGSSLNRYYSLANRLA